MLSSRPTYSSLQISLHWLIAALVIFQLIFGESMTTVVDAVEEGSTITPTDAFLGSAHYWIGITILALAVVRLSIRLTSGVPQPSPSGARWMQMAAKISHAAFYVLLIATPILGLMAFYLGDPWGDIHSLNKPAFIILISIHTLAAMYHQFVLRDGTLSRMVRGGGA